MATFGFVLICPNALAEMWRLVPKLPVTRIVGREMAPRLPFRLAYTGDFPPGKRNFYQFG
jgi:hypothetical protein